MDMRSSKLIQAGVILIVLGLASYCIEVFFYNAIDENGFQTTSVFLLVTFVLGFLGSLMIVLAQLLGWFASKSSQ